MTATASPMPPGRRAGFGFIFALALMNSPFVRQQAEKLAARIRPTADTPLETAIDRGYQIAFARSPSADERQRMLAFVQQQTDMNLALVEFCQVLLCLNEFVYVD